MFYVREGNQIIELDGKNIFTCCIRCEREIEVDIIEYAQEFPDFDLYGVGLYCPLCLKSIHQEVN